VDVTLPQPRLDTPAAIALTTSLRASITEFASPEETLS
jgi:hypothetical protein